MTVSELFLGEDPSQLCSRETGVPISYGPGLHTAGNLVAASFLRILSGLRT